MLRIVHEKHERHEKNIRCRFLADGVYHAFIDAGRNRSSSRYTHVSMKDRRSDRDAGTQAQGGETIGLALRIEQALANIQITVPFDLAQDAL